MLRKSHWKQNKTRKGTKIEKKKQKNKKELTLHWEIAVFLDEESEISFLVDSELEVKRAGIWNARCWDTPLGDTAIVTWFFVMSFLQGQAHTLRYVMQEDRGEE